MSRTFGDSDDNGEEQKKEFHSEHLGLVLLLLDSDERLRFELYSLDSLRIAEIRFVRCSNLLAARCVPIAKAIIQLALNSPQPETRTVSLRAICRPPKASN